MQSKDGSFKGNPLYFGRKKGGIVDVYEKMNKQNPKPEIKTVMDYKEDKEEFKEGKREKLQENKDEQIDKKIENKDLGTD